MPRKKRSETEGALSELSRQLDSIYTALVIRDPGTPISAESYEGLRRQVVAAAQERLAHLVQLSEFDVAVRSGADSETLGRLVASWMAQAGLEVISDQSDELRFETVNGSGPWEVAVPAYVDGVTGRTVRQGRLHRVESPPQDESHGGADEHAGEPGDITEAATPSGEQSDASELDGGDEK